MFNSFRSLFSRALIPLLLVNISLSHAEGPKLWIEKEDGLRRSYITNGKVKVYSGLFGSYNLEELVKDNSTALELTKKQTQFKNYALITYWLGTFPSAFSSDMDLGQEMTR